MNPEKPERVPPAKRLDTASAVIDRKWSTAAAWWFVDRLAADIGAVMAPRVAEDFDRMGHLPRAVECLRYSSLRFEHALSPNNWLRALALTMIRLALLVVIPLLAVYIVTLPLAWISGSLAVIAMQIEAMAKSMFNTVLYTAETVVVAWAVAAVVLIWAKGKRRR